MGMCHDNMANPLTWLQCGQNGVQMRKGLWAGINHGESAFAEQIGVGASMGHW